MRQMKGLPLLNETISTIHLTPLPLSHTPYLHLILSGKVEVLTSVVSKNNKDDNFTGAFGILYFLFTLVSLSATCSQTQFNTSIIINLKNIFLDLSHRPHGFVDCFCSSRDPSSLDTMIKTTVWILSITLCWPHLDPYSFHSPFLAISICGALCASETHSPSNINKELPIYKIFYNLYKPSKNF